MSEKYDGRQIRPIAFPQWQVSPEGGWTRDWAITFAQPITDTGRTAPATLSDDTMTVDAVVHADARSLQVRTRTTGDAFSDAIFFESAYRLLRRLNDHVGTIETIRGQPRDWWFPFRPESQ